MGRGAYAGCVACKKDLNYETFSKQAGKRVPVYYRAMLRDHYSRRVYWSCSHKHGTPGEATLCCHFRGNTQCPAKLNKIYGEDSAVA